MKRFAYLPLALALTVTGVAGVTGAAYAQGPTTSAPGPSLQREPQPANNDLRNPNSGDQAPSSATATAPDTTTTAPMTETPAPAPMTDTTAPAPMTDTTTSAPSSKLPRTGSEMPLVGMIGLLAMGSALGLKAAAKRNA
jgi:LPXTG-motif cell wall-anchored protein